MATGETKELYEQLIRQAQWATKPFPHQTIGGVSIDPPSPPNPCTIRSELSTIVMRLLEVNSTLHRAHVGLFGHAPVPKDGSPCEEKPTCVHDDLNAVRRILHDIEQYTKEIEERIG